MARDPENITDEADRFADRLESWMDLIGAARALHPITRACMGSGAAECIVDQAVNFITAIYDALEPRHPIPDGMGVVRFDIRPLSRKHSPGTPHRFIRSS